MIKDNGHYSVQGIYMTLPKGRSMAESEDPLMLPCDSSNSTSNIQESAPPKSTISSRPLEEKRNRVGKGISYTLSLVRKFLKEPENWKKVDTTKCYHFPGAFQKKCIQQLYYIPDVAKLEQTCDDTHFLWKDIQLSKGQLNKTRLITADIAGKKEDVYYRSAPCLGVKFCSQEGCNFIVPIRDKRCCPEHNLPLQKSSDCPVEFVYVYPKEPKDGRRWIGGLVRCQKYSTDNLHNHKLHAASKISQCVQSKIAAAITTNPSLTTTDITCGKGLGFLPAAVDGASCNSDRVSLAVKRAKVKTGLTEKHWSPLDFEEVANSIDRDDNDFSGDGNDKLEKII